LPGPDAVFAVGAIAPGLAVELAAEAAPQIPAWLFAFAILARSGPFCASDVLLTPALVLAVLHSDPKTSPPPLEAGLDAGLPSAAAEDDEANEGVAPLMGVDAVDVGVGWVVCNIGTEAK